MPTRISKYFCDFCDKEFNSLGEARNHEKESECDSNELPESGNPYYWPARTAVALERIAHTLTNVVDRTTPPIPIEIQGHGLEVDIPWLRRLGIQQEKVDNAKARPIRTPEA